MLEVEILETIEVPESAVQALQKGKVICLLLTQKAFRIHEGNLETISLNMHPPQGWTLTGREHLAFMTGSYQVLKIKTGTETGTGSDWRKVALDTPVWCESSSGVISTRHYAGLKDGRPCTFVVGRTSHTGSKDDTTFWHEMHLTDPRKTNA